MSSATAVAPPISTHEFEALVPSVFSEQILKRPAATAIEGAAKRPKVSDSECGGKRYVDNSCHATSDARNVCYRCGVTCCSRSQCHSFETCAAHQRTPSASSVATSISDDIRSGAPDHGSTAVFQSSLLSAGASAAASPVILFPARSGQSQQAPSAVGATSTFTSPKDEKKEQPTPARSPFSLPPRPKHMTLVLPLPLSSAKVLRALVECDPTNNPPCSNSNRHLTEEKKKSYSTVGASTVAPTPASCATVASNVPVSAGEASILASIAMSPPKKRSASTGATSQHQQAPPVPQVTTGAANLHPAMRSSAQLPLPMPPSTAASMQWLPYAQPFAHANPPRAGAYNLGAAQAPPQPQPQFLQHHQYPPQLMAQHYYPPYPQHLTYAHHRPMYPPLHTTSTPSHFEYPPPPQSYSYSHPFAYLPTAPSHLDAAPRKLQDQTSPALSVQIQAQSPPSTVVASFVAGGGVVCLPPSFYQFLTDSHEYLARVKARFVPDWTPLEVAQFMHTYLHLPASLCANCTQAELGGTQFLNLTLSDITHTLRFDPVKHKAEIDVLLAGVHALRSHYETEAEVQHKIRLVRLILDNRIAARQSS